MGLVGALMTALVHPGPLALLRPEEFVARPARWLRAISRFGATISAAPNFAYELVLDRVRDEELEGVDLSSWLFALDGAETVVPSTLERFHRRFAPYGLRRESLKPVYGLAEAALAVSFPEAGRAFTARRFERDSLAPDHRVSPASEGLELVSCGRPLPGYEVRIRGSRGETLDEGWVGRVDVSGPSIMAGYLGQEEATREVLREGWLDTGDLGFLLEGELYLCGRAKDVIVVRGRNYTPEVIERALAGAPGVRPGSVAAVSVLTERGDELCLLAERSPGGVVEERELRARLLAGLGVEPERIVLLEAGALPRTSSGKIRRREAARRFVSV
jgi:acyl-CoA synthetase (AMP-forming)/AMP-acid ligase II